MLLPQYTAKIESINQREIDKLHSGLKEIYYSFAACLVTTDTLTSRMSRRVKATIKFHSSRGMYHLLLEAGRIGMINLPSDF